MRTVPLAILAAAFVAACSDGNAPAPSALKVTTDSASYTIASGGHNAAIEAGFTNTSSSTIWIGSCGAVSDPHPGTSPAIGVYGTQLVSYATMPPTSADVAGVCSGAPTAYALAPGQGVRMSVLIGYAGHYAVNAPYAMSQGGAYDHRATSADFVVAAAP